MRRIEENETMTEFEKWIHDDITWCGNACGYTKCMRNTANKLTDGPFSMANFKHTETCPLFNDPEDIECKEKQNH